ncbi:hypothetical protein ACFOD9_11970 [Novosphingobium bradum]|uniref:Protein ImuA n=1 Tax=Novosphingobium bradum TaxID=1737444 RepID=A0ABV7IWI6_9SPHN
MHGPSFAAPATRLLPEIGGIPGLEPGRLHEVHAESAHRAAALAFALAQVGGPPASGPLFLIHSRGRTRWARAMLHGDGLARLGLDPARLTIVAAADGGGKGTAGGTARGNGLLRAGLDAARCPALAGVVIESAGRLPAYDLTASRRLALAAERSGGRVVVLRIDAEPRPSAAFTRWTIASAPSLALAGEAPGEPALVARLDRRRGAAAGQEWRLEWDSDHGFFRPLPATPAGPASPAPAALPGAVVPLAGLRTGTASGMQGRCAA